MSPSRRINVASGRPLEPLAHYSRAIRVGDRVLQSGTTAIDVNGEIIGDGDVARQADAIIGIAEETMGRAGGRLDDVVRARLGTAGTPSYQQTRRRRSPGRAATNLSRPCAF